MGFLLGCLGVMFFGWILFKLFPEKHEGKVFFFLVGLAVLILLIFILGGEGGSPFDNQFDHLRSR